SAVNTGTGDITVTSLGVNKIAGTFITDTDGTQLPISLIPDGTGHKVTDNDGSALDMPFPLLPVAGILLSANLLPVWPSDTSLQHWVVDQLERNGRGKGVFDYKLSQ